MRTPDAPCRPFTLRDSLVRGAHACFVLQSVGTFLFITYYLLFIFLISFLSIYTTGQGQVRLSCLAGGSAQSPNTKKEHELSASGTPLSPYPPWRPLAYLGQTVLLHSC